MTDLTGKSGHSASPAGAVKVLLRQALKAALATLEPQGGAPYASLVTLATAADGAPLMLLSRLAVHTQNLLKDPRASLLVDGTSAAGDPLAGGRVSLGGRIAVTADAHDRRRFLARHPEAAMYADFPDFAFYRFEIERAHYVGGFGRIVDLSARDILTDVTGAAALVAAEDEIVSHMNEDHADALALYAARAGAGGAGERMDGAGEGAWKMIGIDPEGVDLAGPGGPLRVAFAAPISTPGEARRALVALVTEARTALGRSN